MTCDNETYARLYLSTIALATEWAQRKRWDLVSAILTQAAATFAYHDFEGAEKVAWKARIEASQETLAERVRQAAEDLL